MVGQRMGVYRNFKMRVRAEQTRALGADGRSKAVAEFEFWSKRAAMGALPAAAKLTDEDVLRMVKASR